MVKVPCVSDLHQRPSEILREVTETVAAPPSLTIENLKPIDSVFQGFKAKMLSLLLLIQNILSDPFGTQNTLQSELVVT